MIQRQNFFQEWLQLVYFYKSSFESFNVYGKQNGDNISKTDLVLYHGGRPL